MQGLIRSASKELHVSGHERGNDHIETAIAHMRDVNKVRVPYFQSLLAQACHQKADLDPLDRDIVRMPGNPMLRYVGGNAADSVHPNPEKLKP